MICQECKGHGCSACQWHGETEKPQALLPADAPGWDIRIQVRINQQPGNPNSVEAQMQTLVIIPRNGCILDDYTLHNCGLMAAMEILDAMRGHHSMTVRELRRQLKEVE